MPKYSDFVKMFSGTRKSNRKRKPTKRRRRLITEQLESRQLLAANPIYQLDLSENRDLSYLDNAGWELSNSVHTNSQGAEDFRIVNGSLWLTDDLNTNDGGVHTASLGFGNLGASREINKGLIKVSAGTNGSWVNGTRQIILIAGNQQIARVNLNTATSGSLEIVDTDNKTAAESVPFNDDISWHGTDQFRDFLIQWSVNGDGQNGKVSLSFTDKSGETTSFLERPFVNDGVPDGLRLRAGWSAPNDLSLQINSLEVFEGPLISEIKEPDYFDIATGSGAGDAVTGRLHLESPVPGVVPEFEIVGGTNSDLFTIDTISYLADEAINGLRDQHWGRISVAPGETLSNQTGTFELDVRVTNGFSESSMETITINIVEQTRNAEIRAMLDVDAVAEANLISADTATSLMDEIDSSGAFTDKLALNAGNIDANVKRIASLARYYQYGSLPNNTITGDPDVRQSALDALINSEGEGSLIGDAGLKAKIYNAINHWSGLDQTGLGRWTEKAWLWPERLAAAAYFMHDAIHEDLASSDPDEAKIAREVYVSIFKGSEGLLTSGRNNLDHSWGGNHAFRLRGMLLRSSFINDYNQPTTVTTDGFSRGFVPTGSFADIQYLAQKSLEFSDGTNVPGPTPDGGFSQHTNSGAQLYWFGYGRSWIRPISRFAQQMRGTPWEFSETDLNRLADSVLDGFRWLSFQGQRDYFALGQGITNRTVSISNTPKANMEYVLGLLVGTPGQPGATELDQLTRSAELEDLRSSLSESGTHDLSGNKAYWNHDMMVHRRDNYYVSTKMNSVRSAGNEAGHNNNEKGYHVGDGTTLIMRTGDEYVNSRIGWDWRHLPGTTTESRTDQELPIRRFGTHNHGQNIFAGAASDGLNGVSAFINDRYDPDKEGYIDGVRQDTFVYHTINSNKGTFFFDDAFVALGADVTRVTPAVDTNGDPRTANAVRTTLNQVEWKGDVTYDVGAGEQTIPMGSFIEDDLSITGPSWFHQDGVGYIVLPVDGEMVDVRLKTEETENDWHTLNGNIAENTKERVDMFHLSIEHGNNPVDDKYQYIVVPDIAASEMTAYLANLQVEVVENSETVQAVRRLNDQVTQIVFYDAGSIEIESGLTVTSDRPALVILTESDGAMEVTVSDPMHSTNEDEINLTITRELVGPGATGDQNSQASTLKFELSNEVMRAGQAVTQHHYQLGVPGLINRDFAEDQTLAELEAAGWTVNDPVRMNESAGEDFRIEDGHLLLIDDAATGAHSGEHTADYLFGESEQGRLTLTAGTTGTSTKQGNHLIRLKGSDGNTVAAIKIQNNTKGYLIAGGEDPDNAESIEFSDASWHGETRSFSIDWRANAAGDGTIVSLSFTDEAGNVIRLEDANVIGPAPQTLGLKAGWSTPEDSGLRIGQLHLTDDPQLVYESDFQTERSLADLQAAGWGVNTPTLTNVDEVEDFHVTNGYLELTDDAGNGDPHNNTHTATYEFDAMNAGAIELSAGTARTIENAQAGGQTIRLRRGEDVIASIRFDYDQTGRLFLGDTDAPDSTQFTDVSWRNEFRKLGLTWQMNSNGLGGQVSLTFESKSGVETVMQDAAFVGEAPDNLLLSVGWGSRKGYSLRLDSLSIVSND